ncbi:MAG: hypothetical protein UY92_C0004G0008 [Candidatus Magasanikbacteria bacterium GW2011_GWA2_56_11]|uniref:Iron transporter n=1 Tax=Candidatus Magasanikbacteria bacterium GW2011_GWA2_56_11 TaxID=1619044 RepID=A0A0G2AMY5_9BACT|nr:MAG: hypothetical protein UY92_C0004G0008 [Candidatus Magasanikbacteria bacterium GW2011_GWA2_56_11]
MSPVPFHEEYLHHQKTPSSASIRELVFGMEDGMVSTMGAITGIATATQNHFTVVLSGVVIIAVESISMAVGSYLSSKSEKAIDERKVEEEKEEIRKYPHEEKEEMAELFVKDGWPNDLAKTMAEHTAKDHGLMLKEMAYRELYVVPEAGESPLKNAWVMGVSYVVGGFIPLLPYFFFGIFAAILLSIPVTLIALFALGSFTTKFSRRTWWKAGLEMLTLASAAALVGYGAGQLVDRWWLTEG